MDKKMNFKITLNQIDNDVQSLRVLMASIRRNLEEYPAKSGNIISEVRIGYSFAYQ